MSPAFLAAPKAWERLSLGAARVTPQRFKDAPDGFFLLKKGGNNQIFYKLIYVSEDLNVCPCRAESKSSQLAAAG